MAGLFIGLAVIAAVVAVWWRRLQQQRSLQQQPGASLERAIAVRGFDEIDAFISQQRCDCDEMLVLSGETSREADGQRYRIVRLVCPECERERQVYFDVTVVFH